MCSLDVKMTLFRSYCTPLYTAHLWTDYTNKTLSSFYVAYHDVIKLMIGLPKSDHNRPLCVKYNIPHGPADDLSVTLNSYKIGCSIRNLFINHLIYADDLVLRFPSSAGLQTLMEVCQKFGKENYLIFN